MEKFNKRKERRRREKLLKAFLLVLDYYLYKCPLHSQEIEDILYRQIVIFLIEKNK